MNKSIIVKLLIVFSLSVSSFAIKKGIIVDVNLSPAGSFQIKGKVKGSVTKQGEFFISKALYSPVKKFKTGMDLRDDHTKKKLQYKKFPKVSILKAKAKSGKGVALIQIRSVKKKVSFTYKVKNEKYIIANFALKLSDFKFEGINYMGVGVKNKIKITATVPIK
mgnify:CR=1 FL=1